MLEHSGDDTTHTSSEAGAAAPEPAETSTGRRRRRAASRPSGPPAMTSPFLPPGQAAPVGEEAPPAKARAAEGTEAAPSDQPAAESGSSQRGRSRRSSSAGRSKSTAAAGSTLFQAPDLAEVSTPAAADQAEVRRDEQSTESPSKDATSGESGTGARRRRRGGRSRSRAGGDDAGREASPASDAATAEAGDAAEEPGHPKPERADGSPAEADESGDAPGRERSEQGSGSGRQGRSGKRSRSARQEDTARQDKASGSGGTGEASGDESERNGDAADGSGEAGAGDKDTSSTGTRRRRRRRRGSGAAEDDGPKTSEPTATAKGSTRLEAKKQRRREGRDAGRRRAPILTEAEFLARRESVDRQMILRQVDERTQIAVLEDDVLVEHYVTHSTKNSASMVGNVYLGRVQNVLPGMEAAFVDIGRGRNAVLYAGEVNWDAAGLEGQPKRIEFALKSGDPVLVQVTKDPIGHKGARLTSQISLPGRYLVYVPDGSMTGISRKLPQSERSRLRSLLKKIVPEDAGVIVRTAAEGASDEELTRDVERLTKKWEDIRRKSEKGNPPKVLHAEPDLAIRVVRDIFNEDFRALHVSGADAWSTVSEYVETVAPDLADRLHKWTRRSDIFEDYRVDEQLAKALDRKVWLPSGGSLVIDHTEAMTVIDVNTGKFTGKGGNLEQTVTENNLEAAEEIVRQVRLRDIGGIIVIDFIDMVLESNRDLVLRRLVECLGRDRTKHQVAEVTSLGLVQMTRKRIGAGLLETFSTPCESCHGRGVLVSLTPVSGSGKKKRGPVKPTGAHDPVEAMRKAAENTTDQDSEASGVDGSEEEADLAASSAEPTLDESTAVEELRPRQAPQDAPADPAAEEPTDSTEDEPGAASTELIVAVDVVSPAVDPDAPVAEDPAQRDREPSLDGVDDATEVDEEIAQRRHQPEPS